MKNNYDKCLQDIINSLDYKPKLLLHSCCGPCSSYVITYLKDYFDITIFYYNPNIEPYDEYEKRKNTQLELIKNFDNVSFLDCDYDNDTYESKIKGLEKEKEGGLRCHTCYRLRIEETYKKALENNFEYFGTTLTVSPYKNAQVINEIGESLQSDKLKWLYSDFKKRDGYKKSIELSHKYNLYRQDYCGCKYSFRT